jgi:hypothetical protein
MNELLMELARNNINASHLSRSIYKLNEKKVSIRTTTKPGPIYWYDISKSVMDDVDYLIYQTDSRHHFVLFPSSFFDQRYKKLKDSNRPNAKQFYINWRDKAIVSSPNFNEDIQSYCCSTQRDDSYGTWKDIFLGAEVD